MQVFFNSNVLIYNYNLKKKNKYSSLKLIFKAIYEFILYITAITRSYLQKKKYQRCMIVEWQSIAIPS